jgi:hypothetical protein
MKLGRLNGSYNMHLTPRHRTKYSEWRRVLDCLPYWHRNPFVANTVCSGRLHNNLLNNNNKTDKCQGSSKSDATT